MRRILTIVATVGFATSSLACDPEDLAREYRALCDVPQQMVRQMLEAAGAKLPAEARAMLETKAGEAKALCEADNYDDGMKLAMRIARYLGSTENQAGLPIEKLAGAAVEAGPNRLAQR